MNLISVNSMQTPKSMRLIDLLASQIFLAYSMQRVIAYRSLLASISWQTRTDKDYMLDTELRPSVAMIPSVSENEGKNL